MAKARPAARKSALKRAGKAKRRPAVAPRVAKPKGKRPTPIARGKAKPAVAKPRAPKAVPAPVVEIPEIPPPLPAPIASFTF
jgi:hypothetical protein